MNRNDLDGGNGNGSDHTVYTLNPYERMHSICALTSHLQRSVASSPCFRKQSSRADLVSGHSDQLAILILFSFGTTILPFVQSSKLGNGAIELGLLLEELVDW